MLNSVIEADCTGNCIGGMSITVGATETMELRVVDEIEE
jgi:hypothetical protein